MATDRLVVLLLTPYLCAVSMATLATQTCDVSSSRLVLNADADAVIGGLVSVRQPLDGAFGCGDIATSIEYIEAMRWALDRINQDSGVVNGQAITQSYVPGVKLGMVLLDSCGSDEIATRNALQLVPQLAAVEQECSVNNSNIFLGVIEESSRELTQTVSPALSRARVPQISLSASPATHNNVTVTLMRTSPSDLQLLQIIIRLVKEMRWRFFSVVYTTDDVSMTRYDALLEEISQSELCVAKAVALTPEESGREVLQMALMELQKSGANGVIYLGDMGTLNRLFQEAESYPDAGELQWIVPGRPEASPYARGVVGVAADIRHIAEFEDHWVRINDAAPPTENTWYAEWYMTANQCRLPGDAQPPFDKYPDCAILTEEQKREAFSQNPTTEPAITAIYSYAKALRNAHADLCMGAEGLCNSLAGLSSEDFFHDYLLPLDFRFSADERVATLASSSIAPYNSPKRIYFDARGDIGDARFNIWNYNDLQNGDFKYNQVGTFVEGQLQLDAAQIVHYDPGRTQRLPALLDSPCPAQGCQGCFTGSGVPEVQYLYRDGDVIIGGGFAVHLPGNEPYSCGGIDLFTGPHLVEAFLYALDEVKAMRILGDVTLGGIAFDNCASPALSAATLSNFNRGVTHFYDNNRVPIDPTKIAVYLSDRGSFAMAESEVLNEYHIPLIGYSSYDMPLDNAEKYPLFLSTALSEMDMIKMYTLTLEQLGHSYVHVLVERDENLDPQRGSQLLQAFRRYSADNANVCVTSMRDGNTVEDYRRALRDAAEESPASALIVFGAFTFVPRLFDAIAEEGLQDRFQVIGFLGFIKQNNLLTNNQYASNYSIAFTLYAGDNRLAAFENRLNNMDKMNAESPWFREWFEEMHQCSLTPDSLAYPAQCTGSELITSSPYYYTVAHLHHVINAVFVAAYGLREALQQYCGVNFTSVCPEFVNSQSRGAELRDYMADVDFTSVGGEHVRFNGNRAVNKFGISQLINGQFIDIGNYTSASESSPASVHIDDGVLRYKSGSSSPSVCTGACPECQYVDMPGSVMSMDGDVIIAALFDLHLPGSSPLTCGEIDPYQSYKMYASMAYAIHAVNSGGAPVRLNNVTLGYTALDSCGSPQRATTLLTSLQSGLIADDNVAMRKVIGWLYGSKPSVDTFGDAVEELGIPSVGCSIEPVTDHSQHSTFFNTISSNDRYVDAALEFLDSIGWKYIHVIADSMSWARAMTDYLGDVAKQRGICVLSTIDMSSHSADEAIRSIVVSSSSVAVVFSIELQELMLAKSNLGAIADGVVLINMSPVISLDELQANTGQAFNGHITIAHDIPEAEDLLAYLEQETLANNDNPWLIEYFQTVFECDVRPSTKYGQPCAENIPITDHNMYSENDWLVFPMYAIFACTEALDAVLKQTCGDNYDGLCSEFRLLDNKHELILEALARLEFEISEGKVLSFGVTDRQYDHGYVIYQHDATGNVIKVGSYVSDTLSIDDSVLVPYDDISMDCGVLCDRCIETAESAESFTYTEGDVIIAGIFDVHEQGNTPFTCGELNERSGYQLLEAFNYAVKYVNGKQGIFAGKLPGVTLGALGLDTCQSPTRTGTLVSNLHGRITTLREGGASGSAAAVDPAHIAAYIGGFDSQTTLAVADVLRVLGGTQISYGATAVSLKDKVKYPYFLRTVPADDKQARSMLALVKRFGFEYAQIVHSAGAYGEGAARQLEDLTYTSGVCVAQTVALPVELSPAAADGAVTALLSKVTAAVVVVFLEPEDIIPFLEAVDRNTNAREHFLFIGSDTWADDNDVLEAVPDVTKNAITLGVETADVPLFDQYLNDVTVESLRNNPWFREYYESVYECSVDGSSMTSPPCVNPDRGLASARGYQQDPYVLYTINAVFAAALGIDASLRQLCGNNYNGRCPNYDSSPDRQQLLYDAIKDATFDDDTRQTFEFNDDGESNRGYHLYMVTEVSTGDSYISDVGSYSDEEGLKLDSRLSLDERWQSNCDGADRCTECAVQLATRTRHMTTSGDPLLSIMAFFDVHNPSLSDSLQCADLNINGDFQNVLAFFYALESLPAGSPHVGGLVVDTCGSPERVTQDMVSHLTLNGLCGIDAGLHPANVLAYLATGNANTASLTHLASGRGAVTVSPNAGGVSFNDVPNFVRTVPSDELYARIFADIARELEFVYVTVLSSADENNMRNAEMFITSSRGQDDTLAVCVSRKFVLPANPTLNEVKDILRDLTQIQGVNIVVTFVTQKDAELLLEAIDELSDQGFTDVRRFNFMGLSSAQHQQYLRGSISLQPISAGAQGFVDYLSSLALNDSRNIPSDWFEEFWQRAKQCRLTTAGVVRTEYTRECSPSMRITEQDVTLNPDVMHTVIATQALVFALNNIAACRNSPQTEECFKDLANRNQELYASLLRVEWQVGEDFTFRFTGQGSGDVGYNIFNLQRHNGGYRYTKIGSWTSDGLDLDRDAYVAYSLAGDVTDSFTSQCPPGRECDCIENTGIDGSMKGGYLPGSEPKAEELKELDDYDLFSKIWGIILAALTGLGIVITIFIFIYLLIFYPVKGGTSAMGYLVLFGILCLYLLNFAFLWIPTYEMCIIRRFCLGVIYALIFACLLVKVLNTWRIGDVWDEFNPPTYERLSHPCSLLSITIGLMLVQVIIAAEWLILQKPEVEFVEYEGYNYPRCEPSDFHNEELVLSCVYVMFLILLTLIFAVVTWDSPENHKESRWILMTCLFTIFIWIAWIAVTLLASFKYRDPAIVIANLVNATVILMFMYIRKIYLLNKYTKEIEDERKSQISTLSRDRPPASVNGYYVNPAYSSLDVASVRSGGMLSHHSGRPQAYIVHSDAPGADVQY